MYILIKKLGEETSILAASESKELLREKLIKEAKRILSSYLNPADETDKKKKEELFHSLNNLTDATNWTDGDPLSPLTFTISRVPVLKKNKQPYVLKMAFGTEVVRAIEDAKSSEEQKEVLEEYQDTDLIVVKKFNTLQEKKAYLWGVNDCYGNEAFMDIDYHYPAFAKKIK